LNDNIYENITDISHVQESYRINVPTALQALRIWTNWKYDPPEKPGDKPGKKIFPSGESFRASSTNPKHWTDFESALAAITPDVGMCLSMPLDGSIIGFDIDNCFDATTGAFVYWPDAPIQPKELAESMSGTWMYVTPSRTGLRIFITSDEPKPADCVFSYKDGQYEIYDRGRFFTVMPDLFHEVAG
jgi:primase-polymerase (primpol)-like protein